jgi:hypothetical protein
MKLHRGGESTLLGRYLLGAPLKEEELKRIEERYFREDGAFQELEEAEEGLIAAAVEGRLSASDRVLFEKNFLFSERRRHRYYECLEAHRQPAREETVRRAWPQVGARPILAFCTLLLACGVFYESRRHVAVEKEPVAVAFVLLPGGTRNEGGTTLRVGPGKDWVRLKLEVKEAPKVKYRAALEEVGGEELWSETHLEASQGKVTALVPGRLLGAGDYVMRLQREGGAALASYRFRVER